MCSVLDEIRTAIKIYRMDLVLGLTEEVQTLVNRMEAKLADYWSMGYDLRDAPKLKREVQALKNQIEDLEEELGVTRDD